jgi:superkiller protein 3
MKAVIYAYFGFMPQLCGECIIYSESKMKKYKLTSLLCLVFITLIVPFHSSGIYAQKKSESQTPYEKGIELYKSEKYTEAIESFQKATKLDSKNANAFLQIGNSYRRLGKFNEAIYSYKQALQIKPKWADALYGLGLTYGMSGSSNEAAEFLKQSLEVNPNNDKAHYNLGVAYTDLGKIAEAAESFKEAARLNPKDADYFFNLGMAYQQLGKLKESEDAYANCLLLNEDNAQAHYQIALVYLAMDNPGFATVHYLVLTKTDPELAKKLKDEMSKK